MTRKKKQLLCEENLRHNEYYGMQDTFDNLYAASKNGEVFTDLMSIVLKGKTFCWHTEISRKTQEVKRVEQINSQSGTLESAPLMK